MIAVITGDIVNSRNINSIIWIGILKNYLSKIGKDPQSWQIFRGDSFQFLVPIEIAFETALELKAALKTIDNLDVRLAIGIGTIDYKAKKITESNGSAFVHSGDCFESLKKQTLAIKSDHENFDAVFNTIFQFVSFIANNWSVKTAEIVKVALANPTLSQLELARILTKKSQSTISAALKRAAFDEIKAATNLYKSEVNKLC